MVKVLLAIVALLVGGAAIVSSQANSTPSALPTTIPVAATAPTAAAGERSVQVTEAQMTDQLTQHLVGQSLGDTPMGPAILQRVQTQLRNGQVLASGDAKIGGTTVPVSMTGSMDVQSGRARVLIDNATAAGMPLPDSARQGLQRALQAQVDAQIESLRLRVRSLTIADGRLVLVGTPTG